jgi:selenide,water dikinase
LEEAGCALAGGHTCEGKETAIGFSITGVASSQSTLLKKSGMRPGDALILTKPLGTGTLLAAEMRNAAKGRWAIGAIHSMSTSNAAAVNVVARHGAGACTDGELS